jgi:deoxyribodipyrimidine photo-lyase
MKPAVNIFWFRRDLRLYDNDGLYHALKSDWPVLPVFIFDRNILDLLENKKDARVEFIYRALGVLAKELARHNSSLETYYGKPLDVLSSLTEKYSGQRIFVNEDYEPYARERDEAVEKECCEKNIFIPIGPGYFSKEEVIKKMDIPIPFYALQQSMEG